MKILERLRGRKLRSGDGTFVAVKTATDGAGAAWWVDTCRLAHGLSKGDRSAVLAAHAAGAQGDPALLMTAAGSITQELWSRLVHLGYFQGEAGPGAGLLQHSLTALGQATFPLFLGATQAHMNGRKGETSLLFGFCERFQQLDTFHRALDPGHLSALRDMFLGGTKDVTAAPGSGQDRIWQKYQEVGAFEAISDGVWNVSDMGMMAAPFMMDRLIWEAHGAPVH